MNEYKIFPGNIFFPSQIIYESYIDIGKQSYKLSGAACISINDIIFNQKKNEDFKLIFPSGLSVIDQINNQTFIAE